MKEQNEKYNELLKKKLDLEDQIEKRESEIAALKKKIEDLNKKILEDLKNQKGISSQALEDLVIQAD